jgi:hypothetical protein
MRFLAVTPRVEIVTSDSVTLRMRSLKGSERTETDDQEDEMEDRDDSEDVVDVDDSFLCDIKQFCMPLARCPSGV